MSGRMVIRPGGNTWDKGVVMLAGNAAGMLCGILKKEGESQVLSASPFRLVSCNKLQQLRSHKGPLNFARRPPMSCVDRFRRNPPISQLLGAPTGCPESGCL
jgi:hypothetical protein